MSQSDDPKATPARQVPRPSRKMTAAERLDRMRRIKKKHTKPELIVRRLVHGLGYRFRLHSSKYPGSPDLVLPKLKKAIFVHGCLWHSHEGCRFFRPPRFNQEYWIPKLARNKARDSRNLQELEASGWKVLVVWECEVSNKDALCERLRSFLGTDACRAARSIEAP